MVLEGSITAYGCCRETGTEVWSWNGLSRSKNGVEDLDRSMVLEGSITAYGRFRETGTEAWSWNGLSRPRDGVGRLGQKHSLGTVYHGLRTG